ncbi:hypothetical protein [Streptomyces regalis]|uniref:hypothetical protein n=1 Tax=Streptomyces regalis TaxID=68262 RepID=UPI00131C102A|nr:hypothetical protein [Streptomyces regalis]
MSAAPTTTLSGFYKSCRLGHSDLLELFSIATGPIPTGYVNVTTEHNSTRRVAHSLTDLINDVTTAPGYDSHAPWNNLQFEATDPNGALEVHIGIVPAGIHVKVTGENEILVHGQHARIELFLRKRGGQEHNRPRTFEFMLGITTAAVFWSLTPGAAPIATIMALTFMVSLYSRRAKLKIREDIPQGSTWSRFTPIEKVTVVGIYVTALGVVGTLASGATDVLDAFKK